MSYTYNVIPTTNPLSKDQLYEGLLVCFDNVQSNPNNTGVLEKVRDYIDGKKVWSAVLDGVRHYFTVDGYDTSDPNNNTRLYGVLSNGDIDPTIQSSTTRSSTVQGEANTVSLHSMTPKDYFACEALNALIQRIDNPLSMSDGTIALLAAKSYKIAQAMAIEAYGSRENDKNSSEQSGTDYVNVDDTSLSNNTERLLYNINESIKANTYVLENTGIIINGTPDVNVLNMLEEPVTVEGTVSVDNFPESEPEPEQEPQ